MSKEDDLTSTAVPLCECGNPDCPANVTMHRPFELGVEVVSNDLSEAAVYLKVRTTSWDFEGERTDLNDVLSLLWAICLRAKEVASVRIVTALNPATGSDSEIYARYLLLAQPGALEPGSPLKPRVEAVSRESAAMRELMTDLFGQDPRTDHCGDPGYDGSPSSEWIARVRKLLRLRTQHIEARKRSYPQWTYFGSHKRGITVVELGEPATTALRHALASFRPRRLDGMHASLYRTDQFFNAASRSTLDLLGALISQIDGSASGAMVVPIDSHVIAIGKSCLVAVRDHADRELYDAEHDQLVKRHAEEAEFLHQDLVCHWADHLDDARFEAFVGDLLAVERGVQRVRPVGDTREADDGRDFIVDWVTAPDRGNELWKQPHDPFAVERHVIVQVKIRRGGVGRNHLPGLRDTLEHYRCNGLLVVAYPRLTTPLTNHLEELRRRGQYWVEWWGKTQLEDRVRRHPEVAKRFPDIVTLQGAGQ